MKLTTNKGFSFVEIIVTISIIAILWVVATTTSSTFTNNTNNSKVTADIGTVELSLTQYQEELKELPTPKWNIKFYLKDTSYAHGPKDNPFAVSGFITETTLPKKYMNYTPLDPRTNQYYWYAKTFWTWSMFELAWVNMNNWEYESVVRWTYDWENGPYSLVKSYNWNDFVFDTSKKHFPYNPEERVLIWNISDYTGNIEINSLELWIISNPNDIINHVLIKWDIIIVEKDSSANIIFSDGSQVSLWSTEEKTELAIADMIFTEENNLFTDIKLVLNIGSVFTQAAKLDSKSNFEVYTSDTVAAVRWTIFWVRKTTNDWTNIVVLRWAVKVEKNTSNFNSFDDLINNTNNIQRESIISSVIWTDDIINVNKDEAEKWLTIKKENDLSFNSPSSNTWALTKIPEVIKERIIDNIWIINNSVQVIVNKVSIEPETNIFLEINNLLRSEWTSLLLNNWDNIYELKNQWDNWGTEWLVLNWLKELNLINTDTEINFNDIVLNKKEIELTFCKTKIGWEKTCTKEKNIWLEKSFITDHLKWNNNKVTEEMIELKEQNIDNKIPDTAEPEPKIQKYSWFWCTSCPNWASTIEWNIQYCTDIKKMWWGKSICQIDWYKDKEWEWERTEQDPYSKTTIKYWEDIINLWNNSSLRSNPQQEDHIVIRNINYWIEHANKNIKLRFKWRVKWGWEWIDITHLSYPYSNHILPKDEFIIKSNWIQIERRWYWNTEWEINVSIDENYEYEYNISLDSEWKSSISFNVQSSVISETITITELKTILTEIINP